MLGGRDAVTVLAAEVAMLFEPAPHAAMIGSARGDLVANRCVRVLAEDPARVHLAIALDCADFRRVNHIGVGIRRIAAARSQQARDPQ
jgi:hypothetical protein